VRHGCHTIPLGDLRIHGYIPMAIILGCAACVTSGSCLIASPDQVHLELTLQGYFGESLLDKLLRRRRIRREALSALAPSHEWRVMKVGCRRLDWGTSDEGEATCGSSKASIFDGCESFAFPELLFLGWSIVSRKLTSSTLSLKKNQAVIFRNI
jgi:hypothetical protein